jgi:hypothetical protein
MHTALLLFVLAVFAAGCGPAATAIPPGALVPTRTPSTSAPTSAPSGFSSVDEAIALAQKQFPELRDIKRTPAGTIGASSDIIVQERTDGWNMIFWQGSGDCPAGCINNHYWYVSADKSGKLALVGEFIREFDAGTNAMKARGAPMWGVPRQ